METKKLVREWEDAYRRYRVASDEVSRVRASDPVALKEMAEASRAVAVAWRRITAGADLPWWSLAATLSAVEAFEEQSEHWRRRMEEAGVPGQPVAEVEEVRGADGAWFADHLPTPERRPVVRRPVDRPQRIRRSADGSGYAGRSGDGGGE